MLVKKFPPTVEWSHRVLCTVEGRIPLFSLLHGPTCIQLHVEFRDGRKQKNLQGFWDPQREALLEVTRPGWSLLNLWGWSLLNLWGWYNFRICIFCRMVLDLLRRLGICNVGAFMSKHVYAFSP